MKRQGRTLRCIKESRSEKASQCRTATIRQCGKYKTIEAGGGGGEEREEQAEHRGILVTLFGVVL